MTAPTPATILTVNAGSTSVRLCLFADEKDGPRPLIRQRLAAGPGSEGRILGAFLAAEHHPSPTLIVHRVVHGGADRRETQPFDEAFRAAVERATPLAPLHNPPALAWAATCARRLPNAVALAAFDSAFFRDLPAVSTTYALPRDLVERHGLRRMGFHGFAHLSMWRAFFSLRPPRHRRVISLQLGGGCSVTALRDGRPVDTSMGFSPLEGLVMARRPGDLDAGALLYLMEREGLDPVAAGALLNERCGLAGISGISGDVRELLASPEPEAALALDVFCYRIRKYLGAYLAVLGGCDAILIGGGAGEGSPALRSRLLAGMEGLGFSLDERANRAAVPPARISPTGAPTDVWVIPTDEEQLLAEEGSTWLRQAEGGAVPDLQR